MSAIGTVKAQTRAKASSPEAFTWSFPGAPIRVRVDLNIIDEIRQEIESGSQPITGLLLGGFDGDAVHISELHHLLRGDVDEFEAVLSSYHGSQGSAPVGYYVAESKEFLKLDASQIEIAEHCFTSPHALVLLVQTGQGPIPNASFFFRDGDQFLGDFAFLEFPFESSLLRNDAPAPQPESGTAPVVIPQNAPTRRREIAAKVRRNWLRALAPLAVALLVLAAAVSLGMFAWPKLRARLESHRSSTESGDFGLRVERSGNDFRLTWNRDSRPVQTAVWGTLSVQDGATQREISLTADELRGASVLLQQPQHSRVQVRLSLVLPDQSKKSESVVLLLSSGDEQPEKVRNSAPRKSAAPDSEADAMTANAQNSMSSIPDPIQRGEPQWIRAREAPKQELLDAPVLQEEAIRPHNPLPYTAFLPVVPPPPSSETRQAARVYIGPSPVVRPKPALTQMIRAILKEETTVSVRVQINERGDVTKADVIQSQHLNPYIANVARNAALMWRYRPAEINGKAVQSESVVSFQFKP